VAFFILGRMSVFIRISDLLRKRINCTYTKPFARLKKSLLDLVGGKGRGLCEKWKDRRNEYEASRDGHIC
jgi:hypothetical protein